MVRSRNWPDLWWQISKIRDIQVVGIYDLMKRWRFETNRISSVTTAQPQSRKPVFDFDLTWWPDLWWPGAEIYTQGVKFNCEQVLKKWRRCAPPFFRYPRKTGGVGIFCPPPPSSARVKQIHQHLMWKMVPWYPFMTSLQLVRLTNTTIFVERRTLLTFLGPPILSYPVAVWTGHNTVRKWIAVGLTKRYALRQPITFLSGAGT